MHLNREVSFKKMYFLVAVLFPLLIMLPVASGSSSCEPASCKYDPEGKTTPGVVLSAQNNNNQVAITLDACSASNGYDEKLINYLSSQNIPATLFLNVRWIEAHLQEAEALVQNPLFEIESHGYYHKPCTLSDESVYGIPATQTEAEILTETKVAKEKIIELLDVQPKYYRPGTGMADPTCVKIAAENGLTIVDWSVNGDHGAKDSEKQVETNWLKAKSGDIIISHMGKPSKQTAEGVMSAIPLLKAQGFTFVKLSDLLASGASVIGSSASSGVTPGETSASTPGAASSCASDKIALLGDSLTVGWGALFVKACGNQPVSFAEEGISTELMLNISQTQIITQPFDTLIVLGGTNDIASGKSAEGVVSNLEAIYGLAKEQGIRVIVGTIPPYNNANELSKNDVVNNVNEWIKEQEGYSVDQVVDFYSLLVGAAPCMNPTYGGSCDNVHPNAKGYQAMSDKVLNEVFGEAISVEVSKEEEETEVEYDKELIGGAQVGAVGGQKVPKNLPQRWKEIDETWQKISPSVGGVGVGKVWDNSLGEWNWRNYDDVYFTTATGAPTKGGVAQSVKLTPQQKEWVKQYAVQEGVEPQLALAIIGSESSGNPYAVSSTGCAGLMQLCGSSSPDDIIKVQCSQKGAPPAHQCNLDACHTKTKGYVWCEICSSSKNNCAQDDRYDPEKNIHAGVRIFKGKVDAVQSCKAGSDLIKCQIAAYNAGQGVINAAAKKAGTNPTWEEVKTQLTVALFKEVSTTYAGWSDAKVQSKIDGLKGWYVDQIYNTYISSAK
ncbi:transglycosylase SLT domain-containing protein [Candidatus Woesearchaeota archaeon]|nr:transglycosylase SLT domain-containing protein [Candidatus Woesearchaeota archaeon]